MDSCISLSGCPTARSSKVTHYALRILPDMLLKQTLLAFCQRNGLKSACIVTCVGSVNRVTLRLADGKTIKHYEGPFEIVSLVGTICGEGGHLHISLSDIQGQVIGGHLVGEDDVHTTAEVVLCDLGPQLTFQREMCEVSGWPELTFKEG